MSADASCQGLGSTSDGYIAMRLKADKSRWPGSACKFPVWLARMSPWQDLSGRNTYTLDSSRHILTTTKRVRRRAVLRDQWHCVRRSVVNNGGRSDVMLAIRILECSSQYQCVKLYRRQDNVVEIHFEACQHHIIHSTDRRKMKPAKVIDITITGKNKPLSSTRGVRYQTSLNGDDPIKYTKHHEKKQRHQTDTHLVTTLMTSASEELCSKYCSHKLNSRMVDVVAT
ncbi:hypothetical protein LSAT2_018894 [Lamellibrachia satsuma]|nr:hypothetical protein LSAT2_018894 [Lamellibrachia satsuma]